MSENRARIVAVMGTTGSGKSAWIKRTFTQARRLLICDPMREYGDHGDSFDALGPLVARLKAAKAGPFRLVFRPSMDEKLRARQFDLLCAAALAAGKLTFIAEELRFFTTPSRAPLRWAEVTLTGRHRGLTVVGASQRPASIDKDFLGNATLIHTGRLVYPEDVRAVARAAQLQEADIAGLPDLDYIEKHVQTGKIVRGRLTF